VTDPGAPGRLLELSVTDLALIDRLRLELGDGLNVLTGETGAGKSLLIDALGLALGARADTSLVRHGAESARVEALFDRIPEPVIAAAIEPRTQAAMAELERALAELAVEDPTFTVRDDPETGQKIIAGMGELHLQVLVERLAREFHVDARIGNPQVAFRESITTAATATGHFDREIADQPHRAAVTLRLSPNGRNEGFAFANGAPPDVVPPGALAWIESAARGAMASGPFAGYALIDVRVELRGAELPGDAASELAVRGATADAFRLATGAGGPVLLEPVVRVEVAVPSEYAGEVLRDLNSRRAQVTGLESREKLERASATVALSRMFGYATDLRSLTRGRGSFSMEPSHYEPAEEAMARFRG